MYLMRYFVGANQYRLKQTGGAYALVDMLIPPKGGSGPHSHATFQEAFYIIDGEIKVITKEQTHTAKKGFV